jgi:hypothetical protein
MVQEAAPQPAAEDTGYSLPREVRVRLKQAGVSEEKLMDYLRGAWPAFASSHTIEQAVEADTKAVEEMVSDFENVVKAVKARGGKSA